MIKIKRHKACANPLFEDDAQVTTQNNVQPAQQPQTNTQPAQQPVQSAPVQQPVQNNTQQPAQPTQQAPQQTQDQSQQQPAQPQQQPQENPNKQKVTDIVTKLVNEPYWIGSVYLPDEIQKQIPEFKSGNQAADPAIAAWNEYKAKPNKETYEKFINLFKQFGGIGEDQQQNQQQPQQQQAVNAGLKAAYSFQKNLMENLAIANKKKYYNTVVEDYFDKTEFHL